MDTPNVGFPVFWDPFLYMKLYIRILRCAEWSEWEMRGSICRVWYVWVGVCVGGVVVYVLWVFLADVEGDGGGCSPYKLGDGCVEFGEDVCSVE